MEGVSGTDSGTRTVFDHNNCTDFKDITWKGCRARTRELEQSFITTTVPTSKILRERGVGHGLGKSNSLSSQQLYRLQRYYVEGVSGTDSGTRTVFDHNNCTDFKDITWKGCRARTRELEQSFITTTVPTSKILRGRGVGHGLGNSNSLSSQQLYRLQRYYVEGVSGTDSGTRTVFDHNNCTDFKDITWKGCRARTREHEQSLITTTVPTSKILRGRGVGHGLGNSNSLSSQQLYRLQRYYVKGVSGTDSGNPTVFHHNNCTDFKDITWKGCRARTREL